MTHGKVTIRLEWEGPIPITPTLSLALVGMPLKRGANGGRWTCPKPLNNGETFTVDMPVIFEIRYGK